ncbi:MAG: hypothetical protein KKA65_01460 [Nanoarchaeota archaeon]|nr:hypothetical protein [Nanoarchaeota archaeon]MBU4352506.1 hypothetical protein [Nanoarchaeota archaeon]MBU4456144.1 hypothetical protein [Nanoarchaeota archaeon]MCG2719619.1 hypothetical protein [Nanoarchaeota archaeon]
MKKVFDWLKKNEVKPSQNYDRKFFIKNFNLKEEDEIDEVLEFLKIGTTITLLKFENPSIIFSSMGKVKKLCGEISGDILGLADNLFMAVPKNFEIVRKQPKEHFIESIVKKEESEKKVEVSEEDEWMDMSL